MKPDLNKLIELRDKYTKALETGEVPSELTLGICFAIDVNFGFTTHSPEKQLIYDLVDRGILTPYGGDGIRLWPTITSQHASVADALTPRIKCLKWIIKYHNSNYFQKLLIHIKYKLYKKCLIM